MNTTTEDVLARLGLQTRRSAWGYLLPALGIFGVGMLAGTGVTLLSMPRVRGQLRERLQRGAAKVRGAKQEAVERIADLDDGGAVHLQSRGANGDNRARASANERDLASE